MIRLPSGPTVTLSAGAMRAYALQLGGANITDVDSIDVKAPLSMDTCVVSFDAHWSNCRAGNEAVSVISSIELTTPGRPYRSRRLWSIRAVLPPLRVRRARLGTCADGSSLPRD
jgi:hypothetical protein